MVKNNPFGLRYSRSCRYVGLDDRRSDHGYCRFVDLRYAVAAIATLLIKTYRNYELNTVGKVLNALQFTTFQKMRVSLLQSTVLSSDMLYAELIYQIALVRSNLAYCNRVKLCPDYVLGVMKSFNISVDGQFA